MREIKIAYFTEGGWTGKVPGNHPNMRSDVAWIHYLNADHHSLYNLSTLQGKKYDVAMIVIPKDRPQDVARVLPTIQLHADQVTFVQEGPADYWTDYTLIDQLHHLNLLNQADFLMCHNGSDQKYYTGIVNIPTYVFPTVMVHEAIPNVDISLKGSIPVLIGGNMCKWYNGMVSFMVAGEYAEQAPDSVYAPSMGRKVPGEDALENLTHLPYMQWGEWIAKVAEFKLGVHLMPTAAAGTFALNCAYWGIPCIGFDKVDTQRICHPLLSVKADAIDDAMFLARKLRTNEFFYNKCSEQAIEMYDKYYHPEKFMEKMAETFKKVLKIDDELDVIFV